MSSPSSTPSDPHTLTPGQAASILGISRRSAQLMVDDGRLEADRSCSGRKRIPMHSLLAHVRSSGIPDFAAGQKLMKLAEVGARLQLAKVATLDALDRSGVPVYRSKLSQRGHMSIRESDFPLVSAAREAHSKQATGSKKGAP